MVRRRVRRNRQDHSSSPKLHISPRSLENITTDGFEDISKLHSPSCAFHHPHSYVMRIFICAFVLAAFRWLPMLQQDANMKLVHDLPKRVELLRRVVYYDGRLWEKNSNTSWFIKDQMLHVNKGEKCLPQPEKVDRDTECIPMESWQIQQYPTCNNIHEYDMGRSIRRSKHNSELPDDETPKEKKDFDYILDGLGSGWYRNTWLLTTASESVALKTLRLEREFHHDVYEAHRIDAMAMERLTKSPFVIDIYSHCGQTAINEYATFGNGMHQFQQFTKELRTKTGELVTKLKLEMAAMIAEAVQHVHEIDGIGNATIVHYDINPANVVVTRGCIPKLNDFNVAHLFYWDPSKNERCPFYGHLSTPWWRSPEEMDVGNIIDEKVDIYSLGNILHQLLVGHSPRGRARDEMKEEVRSKVREGIPPIIHPALLASKDPAIIALIHAINSCYQANPKERSDARTIATYLRKAVERIYPTSS